VGGFRLEPNATLAEAEAMKPLQHGSDQIPRHEWPGRIIMAIGVAMSSAAVALLHRAG
jgi:hypothetical protein